MNRQNLSNQAEPPFSGRSFFSSLKMEPIKKHIYRTREMATAEIYDYIELFYNRTCWHSHLSGVSPEAFEAVSKGA